jgi:hypothetical protein
MLELPSWNTTSAETKRRKFAPSGRPRAAAEAARAAAEARGARTNTPSTSSASAAGMAETMKMRR